MARERADVADGTDTTTERHASRSAPFWRLSDDPASRLAELSDGSHWVLLCHPSEREAAKAWMRRGFDAMADVLRPSVRIEAREDVRVGDLRPVQDD